MVTGHCTVCGATFNFDSEASAPVELTTDTTITPSTIASLQIIDTTSDNIAITLPAPAAYLGMKVTLSKKVAANTVTITPASGHLLWDDDYDSLTLDDKGQSYTFTAETNGWRVTAWS